jgi:hypothetical protein
MDCLGPAVASSTITSLNIANNDLNQNGGIDAVVSMLDRGAITSVDITTNCIAFSHELFDQLAHKWATTPQLQILCRGSSMGGGLENTWGDKASFHAELFEKDVMSSKYMQEKLDLKNRGLQGTCL